MVTTLILLLTALLIVQGLERLVAFVAADGLGSRGASQLPRSHRGEVSHPLR